MSLVNDLTHGALVLGHWQRRLLLVWRFRRQLRTLKRGMPW